VTRTELAGRLDLDRATVEALVAHARSDAPFEVCGLLAFAPDDTDGGGVVKHWEIPNAQRSMTNYVMDSTALLHAMREIEDSEWRLGIYHSHTHTEAFPSPTDLQLALYPEAVYLIVSLQEPQAPQVRAFDIVGGRITERLLTVDGEEPPGSTR